MRQTDNLGAQRAVSRVMRDPASRIRPAICLNDLAVLILGGLAPQVGHLRQHTGGAFADTG